MPRPNPLLLATLLPGLALSAAAVLAAPPRPGSGLQPGRPVAPVQAERIEFNRDIRPILSEKCFACHGPDGSHRMAGLRLDIESGAKGSRNGRRAVLPGKPEQSDLIARLVTPKEALRMPPVRTGKTLSKEEIDLLKRWVAQGAPYQAHWSYTPLQAPRVPVVRDTSWPAGDLDRFLLARIEAAGLRPSPEADPVTLIRRVTYDLTGLPPTPEDVDAFLRKYEARKHSDGSDHRPQTTDRRSRDGAVAGLNGTSRQVGAVRIAGPSSVVRGPSSAGNPSSERGTVHPYEALVERLLNSPRFGERMAIYWLDLVRYADTVGYHGDQEHHISPYRDWVIQAFNDNMPFDQFTVEQLAGDLLPNPTINQRIATGYNRLLQTTHEGGAQDREYRAKYAADRVRNLSGAWMGGTLGCAECHDHKYDPYSQKDFYSLAAFFADIQERGAYAGPDVTPTGRPPELEVLSPFDQLEVSRLEGEIERLQAQIQKAPEGAEAAGHRTALADLQGRLAEVQKRKRKTMVTVPVEPRTIRVLRRGDWMDEGGEVVQPAVPHFLPQVDAKGRRATRLDLARWLTSPENPQTARVFVNRMWYLFFGSGLCRSLEDTGSQGEWPSHPELLDHLAVRFMRGSKGEWENGEAGVAPVSHSPLPPLSHSPAKPWDVKALIKALVMSRAYRQSSRVTPELERRDPENKLFARQGRYRLPAEMIRDTALAVSGLLVERLGGPSARPYQPDGYYALLNFPKRTYQADTNENQYRRGVYTHWQRQYVHPMLRAFDAPSREACTAQRPVTNTPLAALTLLNDPSFIEAARVLAARTLKEGGPTDADRMRWAWRRVLSRDPSDREVEVLVRLCAANGQQYAADRAAAEQLVSVGLAPRPKDVDVVDLAVWTAVARALLNLSETITRS